MTKNIHIKPHRFFLIAGFILGIFYTLVTPPLQIPDESAHFHRAYSISEGNFLPIKKDNRLGAEIPYGLREFYIPFSFAATTLKYTLNDSVIKKSFTIPLNAEQREFVDFPNTSYYSPVSYIPHSVSLFVLRQFNCSTGVLFYGSRIFAFLLWIISMYFIIKTLPAFKWLFTLLALLPMHVYVANSFSADTMTNLLSFLLIGLVITYTFDEKIITYKRVLILLTIGILLAFAKVVYAGLVFSILIIPAAKFKNLKTRFLVSLLVIGTCLTAAYLWSDIVMEYYTPASEYNPNFVKRAIVAEGANYFQQKAYILSHGTYFFKVIYASLFHHPFTYLNGYIGVFGSSDIYIPLWLIAFGYMVILYVALMEKNFYSLSCKQKIILVSSSFLAFVLLLLSQHLTWDKVGEGIVDLVQGRYLIPLFPAVFLLFSNSMKWKFNPYLVIFAFLIIIHSFSISEVYKRFFVESFTNKIEFTCGAEELTKERLFVTSDSSIFLIGADSKNDSVSRTGKSSFLLSPASPYSVIYNFKGLQKNDQIEATAWQKGNGAIFNFNGSGKDCPEFALTTKPAVYGDTLKWNKISVIWVPGKDCKDANCSFMIWNADKKRTYIDDVTFTIKKFDSIPSPAN